ncbi:MAG: pilus assembly protein PilZ [Methylomonas sp.]|nr:MAG: pilus assembly protein PilZ [Methylomonas sp.]
MAEEYQEKRRYFRVNDTISLMYKTIDAQHIQKHSYVSNDILSSCSLATALEVLNQEAAAMVPRLEKRDPDLFEYLKLLDAKINLIAQSLHLQQDGFTEEDKREVNLSADGVAFSNGYAIQVGSLLELHMLLSSCLALITVYARVVQCKDTPGQPFEIAVEYINLKEDDRELLIKHVIKKQMQQLREKNAHP